MRTSRPAAKTRRDTRVPAEPAARDRLPPLSMLRAFEAVGRFASMRKAAESLGVCHTVVSRHVRNLEGWFDVRLIESGPRGVRLTDAGTRLFGAATAAFDIVAEATLDLRPVNQKRGHLRLWCAPGLAARWLTPRLDVLQSALPETAIVLRATTDQPDFALREADAAIIFAAEPPPPPARAALLERTRIFPVASPAWLAMQPPIKTVADLAGRSLIHEDSSDQWRRFFRAAGCDAGPLKGPWLWYASSAHDAALAGQGVALSTRLQAADDIRAGRLVELLDSNVSLGSYWFVAPENRWRSRTIAGLLAWLCQEI